VAEEEGEAMTDAELLEATVATEIDRLARMARIGDRGTAGPDSADHPAIEPLPSTVAFVDGWWIGARRVHAHPGRVGPPIRAIATGLHTCDMLWDEWDALHEAWTGKPGDGACANVLIGPDELHGVSQFVPMTHNSNHMGGPGHGVFVIGGREVHPNTITNSIEIHCAGGVRLVNGQWRLVENGVAHGTPIPASDVIPDPQRPGRGTHRITDYQYATVARLLADLNAWQAPLPAGTTTRAFGETVPAIAHGKSPRVVTHWEMDPVHRSDPWAQCCAWLRSR